VPAGSVAAIVLGYSDAVDPFGALPRSLTPIGLTGCVQLVAIDFCQGLTSAGGVADFLTPVPPTTSLSGTVLFAQGVHGVLGANPAGLLTSNGMVLALGQ
jgi:hypothetical protein